MPRNDAERVPELRKYTKITTIRYRRCPVCHGYFKPELRTCPRCGTLLLAVYIGDYVPARLRNS